jgi:hypothetical protein
MTRPKHLFESCEGSLHDTRDSDWSKRPLRSIFAQRFSTIETTAALRATLRGGPYAWPGGYPLYFITHDGEALSFASVRKNLATILDSIAHNHKDGWRVVACDVNYEDSTLTCADSGERIESAYGED